MDEQVTNPEEVLKALGAEMPAGDGEPVKEETPKFVHEPTGKEFDNEVDYLKYDSGWKNNEWGKRVAELEQKIEQLAATPKKEEPAPEVPKSKKEIKKLLWPDRPDETLDDPFTDFLLEGLDAALTLNNQQLSAQIQSLQETVSSLQGRLEETSARSELGVDPQIEKQILEKHPYLKALSPKERVAVIADMARKEQAETSTSKPKSVPQPRAEDHVEGSAMSAPAEEAGAGFDSWLSNDFKKMSVDDQLSAFSRLVAKARENGELPL